MAKNRFLLDVRPRDADAPDYYDLHLDIDRLMRELRGAQCLNRLCRKMGMTRIEVLKTFTPGAAVDPITRGISINAGYDPSFDEGILEGMIWDIVSPEVNRILACDTSPPQHRQTRPGPRLDDGGHHTGKKHRR